MRFLLLVSILIISDSFSAPIPQEKGVKYPKKIVCIVGKKKHEVLMFTRLEKIKAGEALPKGPEEKTVWSSEEKDKDKSPPKDDEFATDWDYYASAINQETYVYRVWDDDNNRAFIFKTPDLAVDVNANPKPKTVKASYHWEIRNHIDVSGVECEAHY